MTILNSFSHIRSRVTQLKHTLDGCFGFSYFALLCATSLCWQAYSRVKQSFIKNTVAVCSTARLCIPVDFLYLLMKIQSATTISSPFSDFLLDIISVFSHTISQFSFQICFFTLTIFDFFHWCTRSVGWAKIRVSLRDTNRGSSYAYENCDGHICGVMKKQRNIMELFRSGWSLKIQYLI